MVEKNSQLKHLKTSSTRTRIIIQLGAVLLLLLTLAIFVYSRGGLKDDGPGAVPAAVLANKKSIPETRESYFKPRTLLNAAKKKSAKKELSCAELQEKLSLIDLTEYGVLAKDTGSWLNVFKINRPRELRSAIRAIAETAHCSPNPERANPQLGWLLSGCQDKNGNCFGPLMALRREYSFENSKDLPISELRDVGSLIDRMAGLALQRNPNSRSIIEAASKVLEFWPENEMAREFKIGALYRAYSQAVGTSRLNLQNELQDALHEAEQYNSGGFDVFEIRASIANADDNWRALADLGKEVLDKSDNPYLKSYGYYYLAESAFRQDSEEGRRQCLAYLKECLKLSEDNLACQQTYEKVSAGAEADSSLFLSTAGAFSWSEPITWVSEN